MDILSYVMGQKSGGSGGENIDIPVFTVTYDSDWETVQSVICNKTLEECRAINQNDGNGMAIEISTNGVEQYSSPLFLYWIADAFLRYVECPGSYGDIIYTTEGLEHVTPSMYPDELTATENGEYTAHNVYKTVTVAVQ